MSAEMFNALAGAPPKAQGTLEVIEAESKAALEHFKEDFKRPSTEGARLLVTLLASGLTRASLLSTTDSDNFMAIARRAQNRLNELKKSSDTTVSQIHQAVTNEIDRVAREEDSF